MESLKEELIEKNEITDGESVLTQGSQVHALSDFEEVKREEKFGV